MSMYPPVRQTMIGLLSQPRLTTYKERSNGDIQAAVTLYRWNLDLSMALFESIHYLEVALRNRIDSALETLADGADWLDSPDSVPLNQGTKQKVQEARRRAARGGREPTHGHVIAELTFGFWAYLLAQNYNRSLWQPALRQALKGSQRSTLHLELKRIGDLRTRTAHHEPLLGMGIPAEYSRIIAASERIDPRLGWWIATTSRVQTVLRSNPEAANYRRPSATAFRGALVRRERPAPLPPRAGAPSRAARRSAPVRSPCWPAR